MLDLLRAAPCAEAVKRLAEWLRPGALVLDAGGGRGRDSAALLPSGHRIVALDSQLRPGWEALISVWPDHLRFVVGRVDDTDLDVRFDGIIDCGLDRQPPDEVDAYAQRLSDLLTPDGLVAVSLLVDPAQNHSGTVKEQLRRVGLVPLEESVVRRAFGLAQLVIVARKFEEVPSWLMY